MKEVIKGPDLKKLENEVIEDIKGEEKNSIHSFFHNKVFIITAISLGIVLLIIILLFLILPTIALNGDSKVKVAYNNVYTEEGATAKFLGKDISKDIKISGNVDVSKIGDYKITYIIKKNFVTIKKNRIVTVVDEKAPIITLEGEENLAICPKEKYEEIGFKAEDEYDGDLTDKVKVTEEDNLITYTVSDSSNNEYITTRKLNRIDEEAPVITLNGNSTIYVTIGSNYNEPGYTASDNCSGNLTESVEVSGNVNTKELGTYNLTYKVKDFSNNEATVTRKVIVQNEVVKRSAALGCGEAGVIYLTFDDGPNNGTTTDILNILKKYNVKATFFVTNTNGGSDSQIKREFDEGHLVALHTSSHDYSKVYASYDAYWNDLNKISERVERITGQKSMYIRFPGGSSNTISRHYSSGIMSTLAAAVESKGYTYFDWNIDSRDAEGKNSDQIYSNVINGLSKTHGNVVLMHDIKRTTANAIERIIQYGLNNGYQFKVLDKSIVCHHKTAN